MSPGGGDSVEDEILGGFMMKLQESGISPDIIDILERRLDDDDFGGRNELLEEIESVISEANTDED